MYSLSMSPALAVSIAQQQTVAAMQESRRSSQARQARRSAPRSRRPAHHRSWLTALQGRVA